MTEKKKEILHNAEILFPYLEKFAHKDLFKNTAYVWEAVPKIAAYLKNHLKDTDRVCIMETENGLYGNGIGFFANVYFDLSGGSIKIGKNTTIEPGAFIKGPAVIGQNCKILHNAYIRGVVIIGNNCIVGHGSEIKNSVIMNYSNIPHFNYIGDSIIGSNVNVGFMSALLKIRADNGNIWLKIISRNGDLLDKKPIQLKKFGSIIGDDSSIGANISLNPGFILMPGTQLITKNNLVGEKGQENLLWLCKIRDAYINKQ